PETFEVEYDKPDDATGEMTAATAQAGMYALAACTYTKAGWTFLGWKDQYLSYRDDPIANPAGTIVVLSDDMSYIAVFGKTYTNANDNTVTVTLRDDEYVLWNVDGEPTYVTWYQDGAVVTIGGGFSTYAYLKIVGNTYTECDEMLAYSFTTSDGNTTLTFDGMGKAMLGTIEGTYTIMSNYYGAYGVNLTFGGNTYECEFEYDDYYTPYINVTINVGGVNYVFNPYTEYTVSFEVGDGATGTAPAQTTVQSIGSAEAEITLPNGNGMQKEGYGFMGWQVKNGDDYLYYSGEKCPITGDTTFVAIWGEVKTYNVTYEIGDDITGTAPAATTVQTEAGQTMAAVTLNNGAGLTKEGYKFAGWKKKNSDGTLSDTVYKTNAAIAADTTFVAYFEENNIGSKLYDYAAEGAGVKYGFASAEDAGDDAIKITTTSGTERAFYFATAVYTSGSAYTPYKLTISICFNTGVGKLSTTKIEVDGELVDAKGADAINLPNQVVKVTSTSTYGNAVFVINFSMVNGKRTMTITVGDQTVTWEEIAA
ncbi:MAG: InlB B-repeat-containing protein, partial [Clostridiales bacterium]|nr:InlB B-repeat-containing protein [Clostridiales bacterium]